MSDMSDMSDLSVSRSQRQPHCRQVLTPSSVFGVRPAPSGLSSEAFGEGGCSNVAVTTCPRVLPAIICFWGITVKNRGISTLFY
ncbi:MAG: hypothetical protein J6C40_04435, partial [Lentisphaeria bacterium]|nr:hypothetical protein [Lentisphaeria bacterium]